MSGKQVFSDLQGAAKPIVVVLQVILWSLADEAYYYCTTSNMVRLHPPASYKPNKGISPIPLGLQGYPLSSSQSFNFMLLKMTMSKAA
jgi:hypothetical protein